MVEYRGYRVIIRRSGEVVVEGRTADGRPPIGRVKAIDRASIGLVERPPGQGWAAYHVTGGMLWALLERAGVNLGWGSSPVTKNNKNRHDAARLLVDHVIAAGMPRGLRPFKEIT